MKPVVIIVIAVGISVVAVVVVLIGIGAYQQNQLETQQRESNQDFVDLVQKVEESKQVQSQKLEETPQFLDCAGKAGCFTEYVTRIVDGDTIYTGNYKIRLSLTNTPESNEPGFSQATLFTEKLCPVGSSILVDQDDLQPMDEYGRVLAKVYCGDKILNSELLYNGYANVLTKYCSTSEFSGESWAQQYGCGQKEIQPPTASSQSNKDHCDPSYPIVCIPSPPPDLNCGDIPFSNFKVLQPDPHRFDGDKDGLGCE